MRIGNAVLLVLTLTILIYAVNQNGTSVTQHQNRPQPSGTLDKEVTWGTLRGLDKDTGKASSEVMALEGQEIQVPGYVVPLDDDSHGLSEFLLVPYAGACVHTPPPPPNQMIYVKMVRGEKANFGLMDGVWLKGKLFIGRRGSPYGPTFYAMTATSIEPYR